jgi:aconitate hydratase
MLAIERVFVALAAAGEPYYVKMPKIMGIKLVGKLPNWVSAKDIVLEMLRRYNVTGGRGYILEYYGPGLKNSAHGIVMSSPIYRTRRDNFCFPSDDTTREFLKQEERDQWIQLEADEGATYDKEIEIDLATIEPLIALPEPR